MPIGHHATSPAKLQLCYIIKVEVLFDVVNRTSKSLVPGTAMECERHFVRTTIKRSR